MTLVLRSDMEMTDPIPGTPILPDIVSGLLYDFDARSLPLGARSTWTDTRSRKVGTTNEPVAVSMVAGHRGVEFDATQRLTITDAALGAEVTKVVVMRPSAQMEAAARIITGPLEGYRVMRIDGASFQASNYPGGVAAAYAPAPGPVGLQVHAASFSPGETIAARDGLAPVAVAGGSTASESVQHVGAGPNLGTTDSKFAGHMHRVLIFNRAFTAQELVAVTDALAAEWQ